MLLDVNMARPLGRRSELIAAVRHADPGLTDLPLVIDSFHIIEVLRRRPAAYQAKALSNSVTARGRADGGQSSRCVKSTSAAVNRPAERTRRISPRSRPRGGST